VRFDDSLRTVLAADTASAFGAQSAFRQLVDLLGRGRVPAEGEPLDRLRALRAQVPAATRTASARALALAEPRPRSSRCSPRTSPPSPHRCCGARG